MRTNFDRVTQLSVMTDSVNYAFSRHNMKPGKELYLLKLFLVFKLIESSIATLRYFFISFFLSVNYTNMVYILCITFWKYQETQTLFILEYIQYWHIERLSRLSFFICFCWSVNCMSQVSKFHNFFLAFSETEARFIYESLQYCHLQKVQFQLASTF